MVFLSSDFGFVLLSNVSVNLEYLLLGDKEGVKEVSCDSVSIYGACSHGTEACEEK